jgi:aminomethyltransferase
MLPSLANPMENHLTVEILERTALHPQHVALGAKLVPFTGYDMPVQYPTGILVEHNWTRTHAGLFDVSHMGQCALMGPDFETTARFMETLVPADILSLKPGQQRYSQLLAGDGGILDDLMITRSAWEGMEGALYIVVNAGRKHEDYAHIEKHLPHGITLKRWDDLSLLALQGPEAESVLSKFDPAANEIDFMHSARLNMVDMTAHVSRSGYTGEDGFEISIFSTDAPKLWAMLLEHPEVKPIGLGARDSLRLEAGLCLYGHDIDETTTPVEADLLWSIQKRRRSEGGFPGASRIQEQIAEGPKRKRVGLKPQGRAPAREGVIITDLMGRQIGKVTSGGFGPTVNGPIAMGYIETAFVHPGNEVHLLVRGQSLPAQVVALPAVQHNFKR